MPCLSDNYAYLVIDGDRAAVVDPGEAAPIERALAAEHVELAAIWLTHHHPDHVGGVKDLAHAHPGVEVVAGEVDAAKISGVTHRVREGNEIAIPVRAEGAIASVRAVAIENPGHTLGAISFYSAEHGFVFTGDTLFAAGCGRVFEGDAAMMFASLQKLAALPPATRVYFGHEYTAGNLRFAAAAEPDNADARAWLARLAPGAVTTPSTIADERAANPFVRAPDADVFHARREWKNRFK